MTLSLTATGSDLHHLAVDRGEAPAKAASVDGAGTAEHRRDPAARFGP